MYLWISGGSFQEEYVLPYDTLLSERCENDG